MRRYLICCILKSFTSSKLRFCCFSYEFPTEEMFITLDTGRVLTTILPIYCIKLPRNDNFLEGGNVFLPKFKIEKKIKADKF